VSAVPAEIAGVGSTQQKLRVSPGFDPLKSGVGPEEYFVLSRIDGKQTLRDVLLTTGLPVERAIAIVTRLRSIGALLLPGETAPAAAPKPTPPPPRPRPPTQPIPTTGRVPTQPLVTRRGSTGTVPPPIVKPTHDLTLPHATAAELDALAEDVELSDPDRRLILAIARLADGRDPHAILGVPNGSDARELKRAYFLLSKEIHPDRYYGKRLGTFAQKLPLVFEATSRAYARLTGTSDRARGTPSHATTSTDHPQTPQEYAGELFERACQLEVTGDAMGAMKLFAAAVRVDPQIRYLRRATSCALAAGQPKSALEYAKKAHTMAPNDPSSARLLAASFRAAGKLSDAEEVLVMAMAIKSENDSLAAELRNDLAEVRRLLAQ
jgi:hypothetical protein